MPEVTIHREHALGLKAARAAASRWVKEAEREWGMQCRTDAGKTQDHIHFERSGARGCLTVSGERFDLQLQLGFMLGPLAGHIEQQIRKSLDELLAQG